VAQAPSSVAQAPPPANPPNLAGEAPAPQMPKIAAPAPPPIGRGAGRHNTPSWERPSDRDS